MRAWVLCLSLGLLSAGAQASVFKSECNLDKAARNEAMNATLGVKGNCDADKLVRNFFRGSALSASGKVKYDDPVPLLETFNMEADFEVERMLPTSGGFQVQPWFLSFTPVAMLVASQIGDPDQPAGESSCGAYHSDEEYTFEFPASMRIVAVPKDVSVREGTLNAEQEGLDCGDLRGPHGARPD